MTELRPFDRILEIAKSRGLSERKASEGAGLNASTIASARRNGGNMDLATIEAFAKFFDVPVAQLLGMHIGPELGAAQGEYSATPAVVAHAPHNVIHPSPLNPRKRFDPEAIQDLSQSVEKEGVLMQLLVRRANQPGNSPITGAQSTDFEIIAGERRWRAAGLVIGRDAFPADYAMPIRLIDPCSDRKMLKLAVTENVARRDMTPWEEAESFAKLVEAGASPAEIADVAGLTARTVQKRLRLVKDLTPKVREALAEGNLAVEFANVLAAYCPKSKQDGTLAEIWRGSIETTAKLKQLCLSVTLPLSRAFFDLALYKGEFLEDEEKPGQKYFVDVDQFERLQSKAVEAKAKELRANYDWVEVFDHKERKWFNDWQFTKKPGHPKAGVAIEIEGDRTVKLHLDLVRNSDIRSTPATKTNSTPTPAEPVTKAHCTYAHQRKTLIMQEAVASQPIIAMRLVCAALLGSNEAIKIGGGEIQNFVASASLKDTIAELTKPLVNLKGAAELDVRSSGVRVFEYNQTGNDHAGLWAHLAAMSDENVTHLFAALVGLRTGTFDSWNPSVGDEPVVVAVAESLQLVGTEDRHGLGLTKADLDGVRKETLVTCAKAAGIEGKMSGMKQKELQNYICTMTGPPYVFPTLRFDSMANINAMLHGQRLPGQAAAVIPKMDNWLTDAQLDACAVIKDSPSRGISAAEVIMTSGCTRDDILALIGDVIYCDHDNFVRPGQKFPSPAILAAHQASRSTRARLAAGSAPPEPEQADWDPDEKLAQVAASLRTEEGYLNTETDEAVRRALINGINAWLVEPLDTPIAGDALFQDDDIPFLAQQLIDELFEIYANEAEYEEVKTLDDAVVFVCGKLKIVPSFVRRPQVEE